MKKLVLVGSLCACVSIIAIPAKADKKIVGGFSEVEPEGQSVSDAARFAVEAQEKTMRVDGKNVTIKLVKVVSAKHQVVAGMNYKMHLRVLVDGVERDVDATVWRQLSKEHQLMSWQWRDAGAAGEGKTSSRENSDTQRKP